MSFDDILGQDRAVSFLKALLKSERLSGSYLFAGPQGVGKALSARRFAQTLLCETEPIQNFTHPDLVWIEVEEDAATHPVERVRELKRQLGLKPWGGGYRLVVIVEVERATEEAQNALLKVLEEPPSKTFFILTSVETERVLPTVLSRCRAISFGALSEKIVAQVARETWGCSSEKAVLLARLSQGSLGQALRFKEEAFLEKKNRWIDEFLPKALAIDRSGDFFGDRRESRLLLEVLLGYVRDRWIASLQGKQELFLNQDREKEIAKQKDTTPSQLESSLQEILLADERLSQNANQKLTLFVLASRLKELGI